MQLISLTAALLPTVLLAQTGQTVDPGDKLHPYLRAQMADASPDAKLPVYFVMREKLRYDDFRPRVLRMDKETRRQTVMRELQEHMQRTQAELMGYLDGRDQSEVTIISRNWLGNFVRAEVHSATVLGGAAIDAVAEVWFDYTPDPSEVEDASPLPLPVAPGNGPVDTRAAEVWLTGITGAGSVGPMERLRKKWSAP